MLSSLSSLAATLSRRRREGAAAVTTASSAAFASVLFRSLSSSSPAAAEASPSSSAPSPSSSSAAAVAKGVNYLKSGSDPVIASPLPEWIPEVSAAPPTAFELRRALEQSREQEEGGGEGEENPSSKGSLTGSLGARGTKQLLKLEARARIKERNSVKAKK